MTEMKTDSAVENKDLEPDTEDIREEEKETAESGAEAGAEENTEDRQEDEEEENEETGGEPEKEKEEEEDEDLKTKYLRLAADFQNFKKRAAKQRSDTLQYANAEIVKDLLEVMDNFERALEQDIEGSEKFKEGMQMIFDQLKALLEKNGVEEIEALGETFDPNFHNAVMTEDTEEYESGQVSEVMQKGYTLKGKVVRPSMVKVAN
ncbi:MAG: nucleotide exchange factor GrpE [Anaerovoracaceae bacterium]|jgi:molecular chaperone GrpE